jgi:hypothetical protein
MKVMLATNLNTTSKNMVKFKERGIAKYSGENVLNEFINIVNTYKKNSFMINNYLQLSYI